ncbi:MAG TPA: diguanylate cyclase [Pseudoxanthomonas sp.]|nr:diguanylate cyclase [Pseudoxanthomonas sp.]
MRGTCNGGRRDATGRQWRLAAVLWTLSWLLLAGAVQAAAPGHGRDYLVAGAPATEPSPTRSCDATALAALDRRIAIAPPPGGWSGAPQAVNVFNVFAGEVMVHHGDRRVCGRMHDARTRDSRFRAGIGMVVVPRAGDTEPVQVAWARPLKPGWIPTVRIGAPSPVQQIDTARLLVRTACLAVAIALAFTALMGFLSARDGVFLGYAVLCLLAVLWQAVLSGLSGYPEPWLPIGRHEWRWLAAFSCVGLSTLAFVMWLLAGGARRWPASRRWLARGVAAFWAVGLALSAWLPLPALGGFSSGLDHAFSLACAAILVVGAHQLWRRRAGALAGIAAVLPFLVMAVLDRAGNRLLVEYRVEAIQSAVTWFLTVSAYALNLRLGRLRRQRDEMQLLADTDALTGLPNRRAGLRRLEEHLDEAADGGGALTVGFIDIDLFKRINDVHGHETGDRVLVAVARALTASVRDPADVIRMGGEEFLVLLPGVDADSALLRMETMRGRVAAAAAALGVPGLRVTASIGLASLEGDEDATALLRRADEAMYRAKRAGRDRVVAAPELDPQDG